MIKATNTFIWIIQDKADSEKDGLLIPGTGREKPHTGIISAIGKKVTDPDIKGGKHKRAIFHKGVGWPIQYGDQEYLILEEGHIIAVDDEARK